MRRVADTCGTVASDLKSWCRQFNSAPRHHSFTCVINDLRRLATDRLTARSADCHRNCHHRRVERRRGRVQIALGHDVVPAIDALRLVPHHRHRHLPRHARPLQVAHRRASKVVWHPPGHAGAPAGRHPAPPVRLDPLALLVLEHPRADRPGTAGARDAAATALRSRHGVRRSRDRRPCARPCSWSCLARAGWCRPCDRSAPTAA